jgi:hypothetical protein
MECLHTNQTPRGHLRIVFNDRIISFAVGAGTTLGDVARRIRELAPRHYGDPLAIDVTADPPSRLFPSDYLPADMRFEDDPAAVFADMMPVPMPRTQDQATRYRA